MWKPWAILAVAIVAEVLATSSLNASDGLKRLAPSAGALVGYAASFYLLSVALRDINLSVAYAVWSGFGVLALTMISWIVFNQRLSVMEGVGIGLILLGTIIAYLASSPTEIGS